jgi:hypothetical protein
MTCGCSHAKALPARTSTPVNTQLKGRVREDELPDAVAEEGDAVTNTMKCSAAITASVTIPLMGIAAAQAPEELAAKSAGGLFARTWRTSACPGLSGLRYPSVERASDGQLLLLFTDTAARALAVARSADEGRTWSEPAVVYTAAHGTPRASATLTRVRSGQLLAPLVEGGTLRLLTSADDGAAWQASRRIWCSPLRRPVPCGRIVETGDELLMPLSGRVLLDGREAACSGLLRSADGGESWGDFTVIACDTHEGAMQFGWTSVCADARGRMVALITEGGRFLYRSVSEDGGRTWSPPDQRLMAANPALVVVGPTLACADPADGVVRAQFSEDLFDSWRCDRMLDYTIRGENLSAVALDADRLLIAHDRPADDTRGGVEIAIMQRNPAAPAAPRRIIPADRRDRWELAERLTVPMPDGLGEATVTRDGLRLLAVSGARVHSSADCGRTFEAGSEAPPASVFGVLRSGRWLAAYPDWSACEAETGPKVESVESSDGYPYFRLTFNIGVLKPGKLWMLYSDDQGKPWQGGERPMAIAPLVWADPFGRFIEMDDGTVALPAYGCLSDEDTSRRLDCCGLYRSVDGGRTWGDFSLVAYDEQFRDIAYNEMDIQPMPDGAWVALIRTEWRSHAGDEPSSSSAAASQPTGPLGMGLLTRQPFSGCRVSKTSVVARSVSFV